MLNNSIAYYHWPSIWCDGKPDDIYSRHKLKEIVYQASLMQKIEVITQRQGLFAFRFLEGAKGYLSPEIVWPPDTEEDDLYVKNIIAFRVKLINTHLACLYSAMDTSKWPNFSRMLVTPNSILNYHPDKNDVTYPYAENLSLLAMLGMGQPISNFLGWHEERTGIAELGVIRESYKLLSQILKHEADDTLELVYLYAQSCAAFEMHNFHLSLITSWSVVERLIHAFCSRLTKIDRGEFVKETGMSEDDIKILEKHGSSTIHYIVERLYFTNRINKSLYEQIDQTRKARNAWMHSLEPISCNTAKDAVFLSSEMLRLIYGINLRASLSLRQHI